MGGIIGLPFDERAGGDRAAQVAGAIVPKEQSADEHPSGDRAAPIAAGIVARQQPADEHTRGGRADEAHRWRSRASAALARPFAIIKSVKNGLSDRFDTEISPMHRSTSTVG